jgi:O-acetylserine/cysteine efflux transporter
VRHALLALAVVAVWGTNFVVIKIGAGVAAAAAAGAAALRAGAAAGGAVGAAADGAWRKLAAYGVLIGAGQFGLLYLAVDGRITPGPGFAGGADAGVLHHRLAMLADGERLRAFQWAALLLATAGIGVIAAHTGGDITLAGLLMVLGGGAGLGRRQPGRAPHGAGRHAGRGGLVQRLCAAAAAGPVAVVEGPARIAQALAAADGLPSGPRWSGRRWATRCSATAAWGWLLARHPAATVSPMALLVPVFGMGASALVLGEPLPAWKLGPRRW